MPQPMSTPTADGASACRIAMTEPTVAPLPKCTSGITATPSTHGSAPMLRSCRCASGSIVAGSVHTRTGARVPGSIVYVTGSPRSSHFLDLSQAPVSNRAVRPYEGRLGSQRPPAIVHSGCRSVP